MPGRTTRLGYGYAHKKLRARWAPQVARGNVVCARCGRPIPPGAKWDLGHDDFDRSVYAGPEHLKCNRGTYGRAKGHMRRASRRW